MPGKVIIKQKPHDKSTVGKTVRIISVLTLICTCIALLLALVNDLTKDKIVENAAASRRAAVSAIFPSCDAVEEHTAESGEIIYVAYEGGLLLGYCVNTSGSGYVGPVELMVGIDAEHKVSGIRIISISETPGVGSKVKKDNFLSQFLGIGEAVEVGDGVDGISGATFSSKAVTEAVNRALEINVDTDFLKESALDSTRTGDNPAGGQ